MDAAARANIIAATINILDILPPTAGRIMKLTDDATICGKQIKQLNNPKMIPSCFPSMEFVTIVNGIVDKAIQATPKRTKAITDVNLVVPNAINKNPIAPNNKLIENAGLDRKSVV